MLFHLYHHRSVVFSASDPVMPRHPKGCIFRRHFMTKPKANICLSKRLVNNENICKNWVRAQVFCESREAQKKLHKLFVMNYLNGSSSECPITTPSNCTPPQWLRPISWHLIHTHYPLEWLMISWLSHSGPTAFFLQNRSLIRFCSEGKICKLLNQLARQSFASLWTFCSEVFSILIFQG